MCIELDFFNFTSTITTSLGDLVEKFLKDLFGCSGFIVPYMYAVEGRDGIQQKDKVLRTVHVLAGEIAYLLL